MASTVGCCERSRVRTPSASKLLATATRPPTVSVANVQRNEPTCDMEEPGRKTSSGLSSKAAAALAHIQPRVPSVWVTPFAGPVLPDVKKMAAGDERSGVPGSGARRSPAMSTSKRCAPKPGAP